MPSKAKARFDANQRDIENLFVIHAAFPSTHKRLERLETVNKAAIVLLTACWETYHEDLVAECILHLAQHARTWHDIPDDVSKRIAQELKGDKHELAVWRLADGGWRQVLEDRLIRLQGEGRWGVNTPKSTLLDEFYERELGIRGLAQEWQWPGESASDVVKKLDSFIRLRGEIAHRVSVPKKIYKTTVKSYRNHMHRLVELTDRHVYIALQGYTTVPPWV